MKGGGSMVSTWLKPRSGDLGLVRLTRLFDCIVLD